MIPKKKFTILPRLRTADGHLKKVIQMIEDGVYCMDVLQQTTAVKNAISAAEVEIFDKHLHSCVIENVKKGEKKAIEELVALFRKINR